MPPIPPDKLQIGRSLLAAGPVTHEFLARELERSGKAQSTLGKALLQSGFVKEEELIYPLLQRLRIPRINARNTKVPLETVVAIPEELATRHKVLALDRIGSILIVVTPHVDNADGLTEIRNATQLVISPIQSDPKACSPDEFLQILRDYYQRAKAQGLSSAPAAAAAGGSAPAASSNGAVTAIPLGNADEDTWFRRFASAGPVPVEQA